MSVVKEGDLKDLFFHIDDFVHYGEHMSNIAAA